MGSFSSPTNVVERDGLLYVVERPGTVRVVRDGTVVGHPLLDLSDRVLSTYAEDGLLGLAFRPGSRLLYVYYTTLDGQDALDEFRLARDDPTRVIPTSERRVLTLARTRDTHNGGELQFGPGRRHPLWISVGDGGDPVEAPSRTSLRGKLLRIDPRARGGRPYSVPKGNPYRGDTPGRGEVWARGFRNPWRFSFDGRDLWIGDVGEETWEEVDRATRKRARGANFGWPVFEGSHLHWGGRTLLNYVGPVYDYQHTDDNPQPGVPRRCAVTGGYVVRDARLTGLVGRYLFADWCSGELWALDRSTGAVKTLDVSVPYANSFGEGAGGRLYVASQLGRVYRLEPGP